MGENVPFRFITGLPHVAQKEIERDFLAVVEQIHSSPSLFDAIIDPTLAGGSNSGLHQYLCLGDLLANESWTGVFNVGVRQRAATAIVEVGSSLALGTGQGDLALFGVSSFATDSTHHGWDWAPLTVPQGKQLYAYNITFNLVTNIGASILGSTDGALLLNGCYVNGVATTGGRINYVFDTIFVSGLDISSSGGVEIDYYFFDCWMKSGALKAGSLSSVYWVGGAMDGNSTHLIQGTNANVYWYAAMQGSLTVNTSGAVNICVTNIGAQGGSVTVAAEGSVGVSINGDWQDVVFAAGLHSNFSGTAYSMDFTGPGKIDYQQKETGFGRHCILRGSSVHANVNIQAGRLECIGLKHSLVLANFQSSSGSYYTLDSDCDHDIFIFAGTHGTSFTTGSVVDSSTNSRILTEDTDTLISALTTTYAPLASPSFTGTVSSAGDIKITTAGKGLFIKEGSNAKMGVATLVLGTVVVSTTAVASTSRIQLTAQSLGTVTVPSALAVSARTAATSFTILASDLTDTSVVAWEIIDPA